MLAFLDTNFGTTEKRKTDKYRQMYYFIGGVEKETNLESKCHKDIGGYMYFKQQHFIKDMHKWRLYFGCKQD